MESIVLKPEVLGFIKNIPQVGSLPVTNTLLVGWLAILVLTVLAVAVRLTIKMVPNGLQNVFEVVVDGGYGLVSDLSGDERSSSSSKKAKVIFPFMMTFFLYIIVSNWLGLLPGFGTITYKGEHLFRSVNSDLNMTLALALVSAVFTHIYAIYYLGLGSYLKKWFSLQYFPIYIFVGFLEIVSEFTKIVSLSFRLFGNIFAGEVVLTTISSIFAFVLPLPFYFLEIIVGFVQAAVFAMLTLVFMVLLSEKHEGGH